MTLKSLLIDLKNFGIVKKKKEIKMVD